MPKPDVSRPSARGLRIRNLSSASRPRPDRNSRSRRPRASGSGETRLVSPPSVKARRGSRSGRPCSGAGESEQGPDQRRPLATPRWKSSRKAKDRESAPRDRGTLVEPVLDASTRTGLSLEAAQPCPTADSDSGASGLLRLATGHCRRPRKLWVVVDGRDGPRPVLPEEQRRAQQPHGGPGPAASEPGSRARDS